MKIYVFGSRRIGGVRIATLSIYNSLKTIGYKVEYIYGLRVIKIYILYCLNIIFLKKNKCYFITWGIYNLFPFPRNRTLSFLHGFPSYNQQDFLRYFLFRFIIFFNKFRKIKTISISKYSQSILQDIYNLKTTMIRNTIPLDYWKDFNDEDLKKDIDLIFVGRANRFKLPHNILENFEILANKGLNIYVIGDGISKDNYLKNNFKTRINFYSFLSHEEVISYLKRSKYFISCSISEPFGLVFLESLLYGCRTISPRSGGLLEISSLFASRYRDLFNFYDDDKNAKDILFQLNFSYKKSSWKEREPIINILKDNFNPIIHAEDIIKNLNDLKN